MPEGYYDTRVDVRRQPLGRPVLACLTLVAGVCGWLSYDPELNLVYYGTSNSGTWNPSQRPGDNRWATSIFARDPDTGYARWAYRQTPHEEWDFDGVNESILVSMTRPRS